MEDKQWFLYVVDHHEGPYTIDEIKKLVKAGEAKPSSYVWKEGFEDWAMLNDVDDFGAPGGSSVMGSKSDSHGTPSFLVNNTRSTVSVPNRAFEEGMGPSDSIWCLSSRKIFSGPHSMKTIIRKVNDGEVAINDAIWREGWRSFIPISDVPEFMQDVKINAKDREKAVTTKPGDAAKALGMAGSPSTRVYKWYKSRPFFLVTMLLLITFLYQSLAVGYFDLLLEKLGVKQKVAELELAPLPFEKAIDLSLKAQEAARPAFEKALVLLPDNLRTWLSSIEIPEGLTPVDAETIREIATSSLKDGVRVASLLPVGDEFNPSFVIVSNLPDGTSFTAVLRGKEGSLLNAFSYERIAYVDVNKSVGKTPRFAYEGNKPLPKGEYTLVLYESDQQIPEVASLLSSLPKKQNPATVPAGKVAFVVDSYFLGGKRDANYLTRLKEFNERIKTRLDQELNELKQLSATLESMANESAAKFFSLANTPATPKRKAEWDRYRQSYSRLSSQVKSTLEKASPAPGQDDAYALPQLYRKVVVAYQLADRLHQAETGFINNGGSMDAVKAQASQTAGALNELKQAIARISK